MGICWIGIILQRICFTTLTRNIHQTIKMKLLQALDLFAELIHLVYQLGLLARQYLVPVCVYVYCIITHYVIPALSIPYYYYQVRQQRLAFN